MLVFTAGHFGDCGCTSPTKEGRSYLEDEEDHKELSQRDSLFGSLRIEV